MPRRPRGWGDRYHGRNEESRALWGKRVQAWATADGRYKDDLLRLNLQPNCDGVLECPGQSSGPLPDIPTPWTTVHEEVGGSGPSCNAARASWEYDGESARVLVGATAEWINQKDREVLPWMSAVHGAGLYLSTTREIFQAIGQRAKHPSKWLEWTLRDLWGNGRNQKPRERFYILLYACSVTRAVYVDLVPNLETTEFSRSLKCFIARRGRLRRIYSDNGKTFVSGSKWNE